MARKRIDMTRIRNTTDSIGRMLQQTDKAGEGDLIYVNLNKIVPNPDNFRRLPVSVEDVRRMSTLIMTEPDDPGFFDKAFDLTDNHSTFSAQQKIAMSGIIELAKSIAESSLIQPVMLRLHGNDQYMLIVGERRFLAHVLLRRESIRAILRPITAGSADEKIIILSENLNRVDLSLGEVLKGIEALAAAWQEQNPGTPLSKRILSNLIHKSPTHCHRLLKLINAPKDIRQRIDDNEISSFKEALDALDGGGRSPHANTSSSTKPARRAPRAGSPRKRITLGATPDSTIPRLLIEKVLGTERFAELYEHVDWESIEQAQEAWDNFLAQLQDQT